MLRRALLLFVVFVIASAAIARAQRTERIPVRQPLAQLSMTIGDWRGRTDPPLSEQELKVLGADDLMMRTYFSPTRAGIGLYIGYWETQSRGDAVHSPLNCLPGSGWQPVSSGRLQVPVREPGNPARVIEVNRYVIQKGLDRQLVLYWYQSHGRVIASEYSGKFYLVADAVRLGRSDTAIVRVITPIAESTPAGEAEAERTAMQFVQELFPTLGEHIPS
jgi:EpsI family protein